MNRHTIAWLGLSLSVLTVGLATGCGKGASGNTGGASSGTSGTTGGDTEPTNMTGMTAAHNAVRANVTPLASPAIPPLVWSSQIASVAQAYAEKCIFQHSGGAYGENIYATSGTALPKDVVTSWAGEASSYDYATNSCSNVCGHYTQIVWRDSVKLGCGVASCTTNSPFGGGAWQFWVCNYDPPGNFVGQKPY